jgi:hypothetical protein
MRSLESIGSPHSWHSELPTGDLPVQLAKMLSIAVLFIGVSLSIVLAKVNVHEHMDEVHEVKHGLNDVHVVVVMGGFNRVMDDMNYVFHCVTCRRHIPSPLVLVLLLLLCESREGYTFRRLHSAMHVATLQSLKSHRPQTCRPQCRKL